MGEGVRVGGSGRALWFLPSLSPPQTTPLTFAFTMAFSRFPLSFARCTDASSQSVDTAVSAPLCSVRQSSRLKENVLPPPQMTTLGDSRAAVSDNSPSTAGSRSLDTGVSLTLCRVRRIELTAEAESVPSAADDDARLVWRSTAPTFCYATERYSSHGQSFSVWLGREDRGSFLP